MKLFIWHAVKSVSHRFHNTGTLIVAAVDLHEAEQRIRERASPDDDQDSITLGSFVPADCEALRKAPDYVFNLAGGTPLDTAYDLFLVCPDAGCC